MVLSGSIDLMDSFIDLCCPACGQHPPTGGKNCGALRRSPRLSYKPSVELPLTSNNRLCNDCLNTVERLAMIIDLEDDFDDNESPARSISHNESENNITQLNFLAESDTCDHLQMNYTEEKPETIQNSYDMTTSIYGGGSLVSRIVSPEVSKNVQSTSASVKLCHTCNVKAVPEDFMDHCKRCYAMSFKGIKLKPSDAKTEKNVTASGASAGRCRLCTGVVSNSSHQYCSKCYPAKQRDDAKRIHRELYQKQFRKQPLEPPVQHIPYICTDCGNTIHDCSWKTKCPPCYALVRASIQRKPKLVKPPIKRRFQGKPSYR